MKRRASLKFLDFSKRVSLRQKSSASMTIPVIAALLMLLHPVFAAHAQQSTADKSERVRAVIEAAEEAVLYGRLQQKLTRIPHLPGEAFARGDVLASFDCSELNARHRVARSAVNTKAIDLANKKKLRRLKAIGAHEVNLAQSELNQADAEAKVFEVQRKDCEIVAPFSGKVAEIFARLHEVPPSDGRLLSLVSDGRLELRVIVPSKWLAHLRKGTGFSFIADDTGRSYAAKVVAIGGKVDAVSQTVQIVGDVEGADEMLMPGMSGEAVFRQEPSG